MKASAPPPRANRSHPCISCIEPGSAYASRPRDGRAVRATLRRLGRWCGNRAPLLPRCTRRYRYAGSWNIYVDSLLSGQLLDLLKHRVQSLAGVIFTTHHNTENLARVADVLERIRV